MVLKTLMILGSLGLILDGCASRPPTKTALMEQLEDVDVTKRELQTIMYRYAYEYAGQVDVVADEIYSATSDPRIRASVVRWTTMAVPEMLMRCFNHEPLVAMITSWGYAALLREFFETGNGKDLFGPYQGQVVSESIALQTEIENIARSVLTSADADTLSGYIDTWVASYPLRGESYASEGIAMGMAKAMGAEVAGGLGAAGSINEQMLALSDRVNVLLAYMPRQMHWQTASALSMSRATMTEVTDSTMASIERGASENLLPLLEFFSRQRELFTDDIARERAAVLEALAAERSAVLQEVGRERGEVFKEIAQERNEAMTDINAITLDALHAMVLESQSAMQAGIDRTFRRIAQLLAIPFLGFVVFLLIVVIWVRNTTNRVIALRTRGGIDG